MITVIEITIAIDTMYEKNPDKKPFSTATNRESSQQPI